jgi:hypothetical protein
MARGGNEAALHVHHIERIAQVREAGKRGHRREWRRQDRGVRQLAHKCLVALRRVVRREVRRVVSSATA